MPTPTLTVVTPNYNHGKYIAQAIEAVVSQSRPPDQYIIIDDASSDESCVIIESYASKYPYIRFLRNEHNLGALPTMARLVELATGDYLYGGAADDCILPGFFEQAMTMAERYPQAGVVFGLLQRTDESGRVCGVQTLPAKLANTDEVYLPPERFLLDYLEGLTNPYDSMSPATIYRRKPLLEIGGFRRELDAWCDTFAARALGLKHGACVLNRVFMSFQTTSTTSVSGKWRTDPEKSISGITRAAELMLSPQFRDYFPAEHVKKFHAAYVDAILRDATGRSLNLFNDMILRELLTPKLERRLASRILRRILWETVRMYLRYRSRLIKRLYCRVVADKSIEPQKQGGRLRQAAANGYVRE